MKHPFQTIGLFATPESMQALQSQMRGAEMNLGMGLTWNFLVSQFTKWFETNPLPRWAAAIRYEYDVDVRFFFSDEEAVRHIYSEIENLLDPEDMPELSDDPKTAAIQAEDLCEGLDLRLKRVPYS